MKRILCFIMLSLFFLTVLPFAFADEPDKFTEGDFEYIFNDDKSGSIIIRYTGEAESVEIPAKLGEQPVVAIGDNAFYFKMNLQEVTIPEGTESIGQNAFIMCTGLKKVTLPDTVKTIDTASFINCSALTDIRMSQNLETLGDFAFLNCTSLEEITFGPELKTIGESAFQLCTSLKKITLPPTDQILIPDSAFRDCPEDLEIIETSEDSDSEPET